MRKSRSTMMLLLVSAFASSCLILSGGQAYTGVKDRFVGAWTLVSLEEPGAYGKIHKADCTGLLVYTHNGHMSVQVMYRNPQTGGQGGPVQYAQGGYEEGTRPQAPSFPQKPHHTPCVAEATDPPCGLSTPKAEGQPPRVALFFPRSV